MRKRPIDARQWLVRKKPETLTAHILTPYPGAALHTRGEGRNADRDLSRCNTSPAVILHARDPGEAVGNFLTNPRRWSNMEPMKRLLMKAWKHLPIPFFARRWFTYLTNARMPAAVNGILTNAAGEVLLLRHTYRKVPWGIPGGWLKREDPASGLKREAREETGFEIAIDRVAEVWHEKNVYGVQYVGMTFVGKVVGGTFRPSAEVSEHGFFRVGDWPEGMREDQKVAIARILGVK